MWYESKLENGKSGITYFWNKDTRQTRWDPPQEGYVSIEQQQQQQQQGTPKEREDVSKNSRVNDVKDREHSRHQYVQQQKNSPQRSVEAKEDSKLKEENNQEKNRGQYVQYAQQQERRQRSVELNKASILPSHQDTATTPKWWSCEEEIRRQYVQHQRPQWDEHNSLNQVKNQECIRRPYEDQICHEGEDQPLSGVSSGVRLEDDSKRDDSERKDTKVYSFEAEPNYSLFTGLKPKFKEDPFPETLLQVISESEATKIRDTLNDLFLAQRSSMTILHLMLWIWCISIIVASVVFLVISKEGFRITYMYWYFAFVFGSMPLMVVIACCVNYVCCESGMTKMKVNSFLKDWNGTNANRGLRLVISEGFWDSVYPKHVTKRGTLMRDIQVYYNLPNIYIHLYKTT